MSSAESRFVSPEELETLESAKTVLTAVAARVRANMQKDYAMQHVVGIHACLITKPNEEIDKALEVLQRFEDEYPEAM